MRGKPAQRRAHARAMLAHDMHEGGRSVEDIAQAVRKRPDQIPSFVLLGERVKTVYGPAAPAEKGENDGRGNQGSAGCA